VKLYVGTVNNSPNLLNVFFVLVFMYQMLIEINSDYILLIIV